MNDPFERIVDVGCHDYVYLYHLPEKERTKLDKQAAEAGLLVCISGELYMCDLTPSTAIFVEAVEDGFHCYRLSWLPEKNGMRGVDQEKFYVVSGSFERALNQAKKIIKWYKTKGLMPGGDLK